MIVSLLLKGALLITKGLSPLFQHRYTRGKHEGLQKKITKIRYMKTSKIRLMELANVQSKRAVNEGTYSPQQTQAVSKMLPVLQQQLKTVESFRIELEKMSKEDRRFAGYTEQMQNIWNTTNAMIGDLKSQVIQGTI